MTAGRTIGTDASSRQAIYVGLSRGTDDARIYVVDRTALATRETPDVGLPTIADTRTTTELLEASLARTPLSEAATAIDPNAHHVGAAARRSLTDLHAAAPHDPVAKTALDVNARRAARTALIHPPAELVELAGPRPPATNPNRPQWDRAVTTTVTYWATHLPDHPLHAVLDPATAANHDPTGYLRARTQLDAATRNHAATLPTADLARRASTRDNNGRIAATVLDTRARNAATKPAPYITALIGPPPAPGTPEALRHQRTTQTIETRRHRRGLDPTDHWPTATTARQCAIGPKPDDPKLTKTWAAASTAIDRAIADRDIMTSRAFVRSRTPNVAPQPAESSLPPAPQQTLHARRIR